MDSNKMVFRSGFSGKEFPISEKIAARTIRHSILHLMQKDNPAFTASQFLAISELNHYREKYIAHYLSKQIGELSDVEKTVLNSIADKTTLTDKIEGNSTQSPTLGQRVADQVASFGGSWTFIIMFSVFIFVWILLNVLWLANRGFDPYPFILLNLILSCIASMQAPVIMMSQNRQEEKDRERAQSDYMVNLKSELEIRMLHEKIDHLVMHQQQELLEIQKVQIDLMNDILSKVGKA
jgi:uncharacterized membrane protein